MIKIEHIAIWVSDLELMKNFYVHYFDMHAGTKYHNPVKQFTSYFLSAKAGGTRIELMHQPDITDALGKRGAMLGLAHLAIAVGSKEQVDALTNQLHKDGYQVEGMPRTTGDGYYESVVLDPEGNMIEITI
jgi:lactoylglutathione lyase